MKHVLTILAVVLLASYASAASPRMNLDVKWSYGARVSVGDMVLADADGDGYSEVYVGLQNNTVVVLDRFGRLVDEFALGNHSMIGRIYCMDAGDVDGDGVEELIFGLGGAKEVRTYTPQDFEVDEEGMGVLPKNRVLYRVIRYHGGVYVVNPDGSPVWRHITPDSVKSVSFLRQQGKRYVAAGVGDNVIYVYNEKTDEPIEGQVCYSEDVVDEESGWATEADCLDPSKCCAGLRDCSCRWSEEEIEGNQTEDICYRTYTKIICEEGSTGDVLGWRYVEYKDMNGTVVVLDQAGGVAGTYEVWKRDDDGKIVEGVDNSVRDIYAGDIDGNILRELVIASNNGMFYVINASNVSAMGARWGSDLGGQVRRVYAANVDGQGTMEVTAGSSGGVIETYESNGRLRWKQRVDDAITDIRMEDVELDGFKDVIVSSRDGNVYVYNAVGSLKWSYFAGKSLYGFRVADVDGNGLTDFIGYTTANVTRFEATEYYIKKFRADNFYNIAYDNLVSGDVTNASIYVDKAAELYNDIGDRDSLPRVNLLRARIDDEFRVKNKEEADRHYSQALSYYAMNNLEAALRKIDDARRIYEKIGDGTGVENCDELEDSIRDEMRMQKRLTADGYYTKAVTLSNFGNYSGALMMIDRAKEIYAEIDDYNGTVRSDILVIRIADRHYRIALTAYESGDYPKAMSYAETAGELYERADYHNASDTALDLVRRANQSIGKPVNGGGGEGQDYTIYVILAFAVAVAAVAYVRLKKPSTGRPRMPRDEIDEELAALEKEEV